MGGAFMSKVFQGEGRLRSTVNGEYEYSLSGVISGAFMALHGGRLRSPSPLTTTRGPWCLFFFFFLGVGAGRLGSHLSRVELQGAAEPDPLRLQLGLGLGLESESDSGWG